MLGKLTISQDAAPKNKCSRCVQGINGRDKYALKAVALRRVDEGWPSISGTPVAEWRPSCSLVESPRLKVGAMTGLNYGSYQSNMREHAVA